VLLALLVLLGALGIGWAWGGSLSALGDLTLRDARLVVVALAVQVLGGVVGGSAYPLGLAVSALLVLVFLARNRGVRGTGLVTLGLLSNALVVCANGAMPVSAEASGRAGVTTQALVAGTDPRHELSGPDTWLPWLADVVPVALPRRPEVVSPGDVLVTAGLGQVVVVGMTRRRPGVAR
jgi:hypothetical protein